MCAGASQLAPRSSRAPSPRRVLKEEPDHFPAGVGSARVSVRSGRATARPRMTGALKDPFLQHWPSAVVGLDRAHKGHAPCRSAADDRRPEIHCNIGLGDDLVRIDRIDRLVAVAVKYNGWNCGPAHVSRSRSRASTIAHGGKGGRKVARGTASQSGMHPNGCIEIRISRSHDCRRSTAGGETGDVNASAVDCKVLQNAMRNSCDQGGLSVATALVAALKPIPAFLGISRTPRFAPGRQQRARVLLRTRSSGYLQRSHQATGYSHAASPAVATPRLCSDSAHRACTSGCRPH